MHARTSPPPAWRSLERPGANAGSLAADAPRGWGRTRSNGNAAISEGAGDSVWIAERGRSQRSGPIG